MSFTWCPWYHGFPLVRLPFGLGQMTDKPTTWRKSTDVTLFDKNWRLCCTQASSRWHRKIETERKDVKNPINNRRQVKRKTPIYIPRNSMDVSESHWYSIRYLWDFRKSYNTDAVLVPAAYRASPGSGVCSVIHIPRLIVVSRSNNRSSTRQ